MLRSKLLLTIMAILVPLAASGQQPTANVKCESGPVEKMYGGTKWLVYGCDDKASMAIVTAQRNPAAPFYFFFSRDGSGYHLSGEGTGDKKFTDAAYKDLAALTGPSIVALLAETSRR